ncbi:SDR family NAD(P)-dependent oxidoreductase [Mucilaginibacter terrae]|uniref:SDR family NAD(P)-dependent oxidoreductase n=1 Tax=Mucilaginibacter terrae TaxID=1955052 RepID=UPI0036284F95
MISILGCGWYGLALGKALVKNDAKVKGSTTSAARLHELANNGLVPYILQLPGTGSSINEDFFSCQTLIISIPPKLRSGDGDNYIVKLQLVISLIIKHQIKQVIYISSTGVYLESNSVVNELTVPNPDTLPGKILFEAEELFRNQTDFKATIIRFGGLVGPGRHPGRFFAGKQNIPNGQAPVNLIHQQDCVGLTQSILNQQAFGYTFNACSPHHPHKSWYYTQAAVHAGLPLPHFVDELKDWKAIDSVNVPAVLGYEFKVNDWQKCFDGNLF